MHLAGKSTLIKAMADALGRKDVGVADIGIKAHTKRVGAYQLKDTLWVLDCPGSDSISDVSRDIAEVTDAFGVYISPCPWVSEQVEGKYGMLTNFFAGWEPPLPLYSGCRRFVCESVFERVH